MPPEPRAVIIKLRKDSLALLCSVVTDTGVSGLAAHKLPLEVFWNTLSQRAGREGRVGLPKGNSCPVGQPVGRECWGPEGRPHGCVPYPHGLL